VGNRNVWQLLRNKIIIYGVSMNEPVLEDTLIGEEWMALRQVAYTTKAAAIPRSVRARLETLGLVVRDDYGLVLTERGRRLIATAN
jgi:ribosomal protein S19E (S16A)